MTKPPQPPSVPTEKTEATPTLEQRKEWHPPVTDPMVASSRLQTLINRLRYRSDDYNADIAELELRPFIEKLKAPPPPTTGGGAGLREKAASIIYRELGGQGIENEKPYRKQEICLDIADEILRLLPAPSPVTGGRPDLAKVREVALKAALGWSNDTMHSPVVGVKYSWEGAIDAILTALQPYLASGTPTTAGDSRHDDRSEVAQHLNYIDGVIQTCQLNGGDGNRVNLPAVRETIVRLRQLLIKSDAAATSRRREEGKES